MSWYAHHDMVNRVGLRDDFWCNRSGTSTPHTDTTLTWAPNKKADLRPTRLLALVPFFSLLSPPWRRQVRPGQKRPTKEGRKKNRTKASKWGHIPIHPDPPNPYPKPARPYSQAVIKTTLYKRKGSDLSLGLRACRIGIGCGREKG